MYGQGQKRGVCTSFRYNCKNGVFIIFIALKLQKVKAFFDMSNNNTSLKGKNVVITGASKGIGRAIAEMFAAEGAHLFLCARNDVQLYNAVAALQTGNESAVIKAKAVDLSNKEQAIGFGNWINQHGTVDILVNNAGHFLPGSIYNEADGVFEKMIASNISAAYHLTRILLPKMMTAKAGYIFNMCSIASMQAYKNGGSYSISKFAMLGFSKNLREELKPYNIKVCAISPGAVLTDSWTDFDNSKHRIMETSDIAKIILTAVKLSPAAVLEDIVLRPQLGDL
jgi:short-subunit dehydrogenase